MIKLFSIKDSEQWNRYLNMLPEESVDIYYTPEYYQLYELNGDGIAKCVVFESKLGIVLYPFLINELPSEFKFPETYYDIQGAYGYNGAIFSNSTKELQDMFAYSFEEFCKKNNIIAEFTRFNPLLNNSVFFENHIDVSFQRQTVFLDLQQSEEEIWKNSFSSNNRNMIRKAQKSGIEIEISDKWDDYKAFFDIYTETMVNVDASEYYFFNLNYFKNYKKYLAANHKLLIAKLNGEIICGMLLMYKGQFAHYHLSGRRREYSKLAPNNLILFEAIKYSKSIGCKVFHFGGGNTNDRDDFLLKFKSNFSKGFSEFKIGKKIYFPKIYSIVIKQWEGKNENLKESKNLLRYRN